MERLREGADMGADSPLVQVGLRLSMEARRALAELQILASRELGFKVSQSDAVSMAIMESLRKRTGSSPSSGNE